MTDKTQKDELTVGQRVAIEINRAEAEGLFESAQERIKKGAYEGGRGNKKNPMNPGSGGLSTPIRKVIAERVGVSEKPVQQLLTIKRKRPDLFQRVFNGWYKENGKEMTIGEVYRMMKVEEKGGDYVTL